MEDIVNYIKNSVSKDVIKAYIELIKERETIYSSQRVVEVEPGKYMSSKAMIWVLEKLLECTTVELLDKGDEDGE